LSGNRKKMKIIQPQIATKLFMLKFRLRFLFGKRM
jgi:hypothetical protein